jgi:hypothetical protein
MRFVNFPNDFNLDVGLLISGSKVRALVRPPSKSRAYQNSPFERTSAQTVFQTAFSGAMIHEDVKERHLPVRRMLLLPRAPACCQSNGCHNLAKVGVEGSNPFARSNFLQGNQWLRTVLRGRFLLPRLGQENRGSAGEAAGSMSYRAHGHFRHWYRPEAVITGRFQRTREPAA